MSAEVLVKKRGRPKKIIPEVAEIEVPETLKKPSTTRAKSTKTTAAKATKTNIPKTKATTTAKSKIVSPKTVSKSATVVTSKLGEEETKTIQKKDVLDARGSEPEAPSKPSSRTTEPIVKSPTPKLSDAATWYPKDNSQDEAKRTSSTVAVDEHTTKAKRILEKPAVVIQSHEPAPIETKIIPSETSAKPITISSSQSPQEAPTPRVEVRKTVAQTASADTTKPKKSSSVKPPTSKILSQVRELEQKTASSAKPSAPSSPSSTDTAALSSSSKSLPSASAAPTTLKQIPPMSPPTNKEPPYKATAKSRIPIAGLNKEIVSNITARAGARPRPASAAGSGSLPSNYNNVARKVTMAIVAAPIAIVTSYVLYQRCKYFLQ
jgi:hypothetical protein